MVMDIYSGQDQEEGNFNSSNPIPQMVVKGTLYFAATDELHGRELWKSDGTEAGPVLVVDLNPVINSDAPAGANPDFFMPAGDSFYFSANDGVHGIELWRSDGTAGGTLLVKDINAGPGSGTSVDFPYYGPN